MEQFRIPPKRAAALELASGEELDVVDPVGGQVADLFAVDPDDPIRRFSSKYTMRQMGRLRSRPATRSTQPTADRCSPSRATTAGSTTCCSHLATSGYSTSTASPESRAVGRISPKRSRLGCPRTSGSGTAERIHAFDGDDHVFVDVREPVSDPGDTHTVRAEEDVVVGVSACAPEATVNAGVASPIDLEVPNGADPSTTF